ncbi:MAG: glycosyltransferase [Bacteroidaceae bacterium]|nr:glycosyltransferase [Bacteroidaceae bacterium]
MKKINVSIIIPCYGVEKYLNRCLCSIVNQTLKNIEIILVDDGSLDKVPSMCDDWEKKDSRIKVIHKENGGLGFARNSGLEIASGDFIAFVDSDDYVELDMYEKLYNEAVKENADVVFCGFKNETKKGKWQERKEVVQNEVLANNKDIQNFMLDMVACAPYVPVERKYQMSVWHSIYKRSVIVDNKIRFYSEREIVSEDIPFQIDFLKKCNKLVYIPQAFYYYCLNAKSLTATYKTEKFEGFKRLRSLLLTKLENTEGGSDRVNRLFIGYVRSDLFNLLNSNRTDSDSILKNIMNDDIWDTIKIQYDASYLSMYPRIIYKLIVLRKTFLLKMIISFISVMKKVKLHND